jgi:2-(1,2-epoxy-1,2-dihydrophenyl)acetyl-CoA isomerase
LLTSVSRYALARHGGNEAAAQHGGSEAAKAQGAPDMADDRPLDEQVTWQRDGAVALINIDAPEQGNALTADRRDRLAELMSDASVAPDVRAVVLSATGARHFCTGAALGGTRAPSPARPIDAPDRAVGDAARLIRRGWQSLIGAVLDCEKPVVAAVNGTAAGGGAQLVLACDLVVMADHARFIEVFVRRGIMPDAGAAYLLPRLVGLHRAKEILMLGDEVDAPAARALGIANRVVTSDEVAGTALALARRLANGPTRALAMTKWLLNRAFESDRRASFDDEAFAQELVSATADAREGMTAFVERREPVFRGW